MQDPRWTEHWVESGQGGTTIADAALADHVHRALGPGEVIAGRLCPACGSDTHGRPWVRLAGRTVGVSLSRSGPHLVTAVRSDGRAIGIDVEDVAQVTRRLSRRDVVHPADAAVLATVEVPDRLAYAWVAKEAILKWAGVGLTRPMTQVPLPEFDVVGLDAPDGYVAVVCLGRRQGSGGRGSA